MLNNLLKPGSDELHQELLNTTLELVRAGHSLDLSDIAQHEGISTEEAKHKYRSFMKEIHQRRDEDWNSRFRRLAEQYRNLSGTARPTLIDERPRGMSVRRARLILKELGIPTRARVTRRLHIIED